MDQCKHCIVRGDLDKCLETSCSYHELWFTNELISKFKELFETAETTNTWINNHFSDPPLCSGDYRGEECERLNTVISEVGHLIKKLP